MISTKVFCFCFRLRFSLAEREDFTLFEQEVDEEEAFQRISSSIYLSSVTLKLSPTTFAYSKIYSITMLTNYKSFPFCSRDSQAEIMLKDEVSDIRIS